MTTIYDLIACERGSPMARRSLDAMMRVFAVAAVDEGVIRAALSLGWRDLKARFVGRRRRQTVVIPLSAAMQQASATVRYPVLNPRAALAWQVAG